MRLVESSPLTDGESRLSKKSNLPKNTQLVSGKSPNFNSGLSDFNSYSLVNMLRDLR